MRRKFDFCYLLLLFPLLRMCLPWLQYRTPAFWVLPFLIIWFAIMLAHPILRVQSGWRVLRGDFICLIFLFLLYLFLPFIYGIKGDGRPELSVYNFLSQVVMRISFVGILYFSVRNNRFREIKFLGFVLCCVMIYDGGMALLHGKDVTEGAARVLVGAYNGRESADFTFDAAVIYEAGMGGYDFMYIYAYLVPMFFYAVFKAKGGAVKVFCAVVALAGVCSVRGGGLQTPIFVMTLGCFLVVVALIFKLRKLLLGIGLAICIGLLVFIDHAEFFSPLAAPIEYFAEHTEREVYKNRLESIAKTLRGDKYTYAYNRYQLQKQSLDSFFAGSIIFGEGSAAKEGGHSELLDRLAFYGLIGFAIFTLVIVFEMRFCNDLSRMYFGWQLMTMVYCYLAMFLFTTIANPVNICYGQIFILLPFLALHFEDCPLRELTRKEKHFEHSIHQII